jgi:outer membrane protein assembly factor BamD (BamD/ComL family)
MNRSKFQKLGTFLTLNYLISTSRKSEQVKTIFTGKAISKLLGQEVWRQANTKFEKLRNEVAFPPASQEVIQLAKINHRTQPSSSQHSLGPMKEA